MKSSFLFIFLFYSGFSLACSCLSTVPLKRAFNSAEAVVLAEVINGEKNSFVEDSYTELRLLKTWKGKYTDSLTVKTYASSTFCGVAFEMEKQYVLYLYKDKDSSYFITHMCGRNISSDFSLFNEEKNMLDNLVLDL